MTIHVVVADDQEVVRVGFAAILHAADGFEVVGVAADGRELLAEVARSGPDVAVVDVRMPVLDGIAATRQLAEKHPGTRVLILTTFDLDEYVFDALQAGASGFLLKDVRAELLVEGVRAVAGGSMLFGAASVRRLIDDFTRSRGGASRQEDPAVSALGLLTPREREVLGQVARGLSNAEIAGELTIAEETVKSHVSEILRKLRRRDRVQLVIVAYEAGLVTR